MSRLTACIQQNIHGVPQSIRGSKSVGVHQVLQCLLEANVYNQKASPEEVSAAGDVSAVALLLFAHCTFDELSLA